MITFFAQPTLSTSSETSSLALVAANLVEAILSGNQSLIHLECAEPKGSRYEYLRSRVIDEIDFRPRFFFALDLYQSANVLPRLLSSIIHTMHFLGPQNCALSITEGRSSDGTLEALVALKPELSRLGVVYFLHSSDLNPLQEGVDRVQALAGLRNLALSPLATNPHDFHLDTAVIFINDVSLCPEDILELLHQRVHQSAHMMCSMDWNHSGRLFYDVWISRTMTGDTFFEIPQDGSWQYAGNLFWNDPELRGRLDKGTPFQVFSCWNGMVVFTAKPLMQRLLEFRGRRSGGCPMGEPSHFCADMWRKGYGRIGVVPSVNLGYSDQESAAAKDSRGSVAKWVEEEDGRESKIAWATEPPHSVKCYPDARWDQPRWVSWTT